VPVPGLAESVPVEISDTLEFLLGSWHITRSIDDHLSGRRGRFEGMATVTRSATGAGDDRDIGAYYFETGELRFGTHVGQADRRLRYVALGDGAVTVRFADGRAFVDLDLTSGEWQSNHLCGEDLYEIDTFARSADLVEELWRVRGPAKDYDAVAYLVRVT
jgi:hypothetical protein